MVEKDKNSDEFDIFIANSIYPEAEPIFTTRPGSLEEIKDDCYIQIVSNYVLDQRLTSCI